MEVFYVAAAIVALVVGALLGLLFANKNANGKLNQAKTEAAQLVGDAQKQAETISET